MSGVSEEANLGATHANTTLTEEATQKRSIGNVKWFNNRSGYGFITYQGSDGPVDVFAHHTALVVGKTDMFKYLVEGEYVSFDWESTKPGTNHQWQAGNITGVNGGPLMCETREARRPPPEQSQKRRRRGPVVEE